MGVEASYNLFPTSQEEIGQIAERIKARGIKGVNVTIPYKETILSQLDGISDEAKAIGAINTISLRDNKLYGYNTDYFGFGKLLSASHIEVNNKTAVILGTGGSSKAVTAYLLDNQIKKIYLITRNKHQSITEHQKVSLMGYEDLKEITGELLINTTPVGMYPHIQSTPVDVNIVSNYKTLVDLIYNPKETEFLKLGSSQGKVTLDGLYMLVAQAVKAQEIWQEREIPDHIIDKIYKDLELYSERPQISI